MISDIGIIRHCSDCELGILRHEVLRLDHWEALILHLDRKIGCVVGTLKIYMEDLLAEFVIKLLNPIIPYR